MTHARPSGRPSSAGAPAAPRRESLSWDELADRAGISSRHLFRLLAARTVSELVADRVSCRIGLHPALLWPKEWFRQEHPRRAAVHNARKRSGANSRRPPSCRHQGGPHEAVTSAKPFTAELKSVLPATATRSGLPMLSGVRLEASEEWSGDRGDHLSSPPDASSVRRDRRGRRLGRGSPPRLWSRPSRR